MGYRHPTLRNDPDTYAPTALGQMQQLALLPDPCMVVDASPAVPLVLQRVRRVLASRVFHVATAAFDGMDHLTGAPSPIDGATATTLAHKCHLTSFSTDAPGLARLARMAKVLDTNP